MNLAQLIDPERVQEAARGKDPLALRPAPLPPMGVVVRDPDQKVTQSQLRGIAAEDARAVSASPYTLIHDVVSKSVTGLTFEEIAREVGDRFDEGRIKLALQGLVQQKRLRRAGPRGSSRWFPVQAPS